MKKILILDVDSCYFCPCSSAEVGWLGNITRSLCQAKGKENTVYMDAVSGVPEWCPLKPMPQKKKHSEQEDTAEDDYEDEYDYWEIEGYNACLDEILGETE